tara:strand:- start:479 stop:811 length:333 start_codon:yes stop_codon:yes gene_type:complete
VVVEDKILWSAYFKKIQPVCPWSWDHWCQGLIDITEDPEYKQLGKYTARVCIRKDHRPSFLEYEADFYNNLFEDEEWLWSHPDYGRYSTPVPVVIQQNRAILEQARNKEK